MPRSTGIIAVVLVALTATTDGQSPDATAKFSPKDRAFVAYAQPLLAIAHAQIVDGTGAPPKTDMTMVVRDGRIETLGPSSQVKVPIGATTIDAKGKTLLPGLVMVHEHMFYPSQPGIFVQLPYSFSRLYLAGGTTTLRTGGTLSPDMDLNLRRAIEAGLQPGPDMDVTGPYIGGPSSAVPAIPYVANAREASDITRFWASRGVTSFKVYEDITRDELKAVVREAHARRLKVTGHLCSVTHAEAADLGIDNIEHSFMFPTDFVANKKADVCPDSLQVQEALARIDSGGPEAASLIKKLVAHNVALTSTLAVAEIRVAGVPKQPEVVLQLLTPQCRAAYEQGWASYQTSPIAKANAAAYLTLVPMERRFVAMGGLLLSGTDPTSYGGLLPGFAALRQLTLLVKGGFSLPEAVQISTLNGARFLGREKNVGSIQAGKRADLLLIDGDPVADIAALDQLSVVFKAGVGYRRKAILDSLRGKVGLY